MYCTILIQQFKKRECKDIVAVGIEMCQVTVALHELVDGLTLAVEEGSPARHDWGRESRLKSTPLYIESVCTISHVHMQRCRKEIVSGGGHVLRVTFEPCRLYGDG